MSATVTRAERERLAHDSGLREAIVTKLQAGERPPEIASALGCSQQRVWNVRTALERLCGRPEQARERVCLTCGHGFPSWGPGNRRCRACSRLEDHAGPYEASFGSHVKIRLR